jgi:peptide/nickel transport system substrate-binding protein
VQIAGLDRRTCKWFVSWAFVVSAICAAGCGSSGSAKPAPIAQLNTSYHAQSGIFGGSLTYAAPGPLDTLDVYSSGNLTVLRAGAPLWARLWTFAPDGAAVPDLVQEVPTLQNGLVKQLNSAHMDITIKLKPGLRWSNGSPLTTSDLAFTMGAICSGQTSFPTALGFDDLTGWSIVNATEMIWHFGPNPAGHCGLQKATTSGIYGGYLLMTFQPMPKAVLGSVPVAKWATGGYFADPKVTSGPYEVQSFSPGSAAALVMKPNPYYADGRAKAPLFGHKPYLSRVVYKTFGDTASMLAGLESGDTDVAFGLAPQDARALQGRSNVAVVSAYPDSEEDLWFNTGNNTAGCSALHYAQTCGRPTPWKDDPALRRALGEAIDRAALIRLNGGGRLQPSFMPKGSPWYDRSLSDPSYDPAHAERDLAADGWKVGPGGVREKAGRKLEFTISAGTGSPLSVAMEEQLRADWAKVGAKITSFANATSDALFGDFSEGGLQATGQYDILLSGSIHGPDPDVWSAYAELSQIPSPQNPGGGNRGYWDDPKLNELFLEGESALGPAQRKTIYDQAQEEFVNYAGMQILFEAPTVSATSRTVGNFSPGGPYPGFETWNVPDWFVGR